MKKSWLAYISCAVAVGLSLVSFGFKLYLITLIIGVSGVILGVAIVRSPEWFENSLYHDSDPLEELMIRICGGTTTAVCGIMALASVVMYGVTSVGKALETLM